MRVKGKNLWDIGSILWISIFGIFLLWLVVRHPSWNAGECDDYVLAAMAIQMTGNLEITEEVVEQAKEDFPNFAGRIENSWEGVRTGNISLYTAQDGKIYPWYGGGYSAFCLPFKFVLKVFGRNQSYAFLAANFFIYMAALLYVFFFLQRERKTVFLTILALTCSPTVVYSTWPSAEIFIFGFVVLSLVNYLNDNCKRAAFYLSVAGAMNTTVMVLGMAYILDYLWMIFLDVRSIAGFRDTFKKNFMKILLFGICFVPSLTTYIYNLIHMGVLELQTTLALAQTKGWMGRFLAYLFDLNLGYMVYYLLAFFMWMAVFVTAFVKKERKIILLSIGFLGVVAAYSLTMHINCGMMGIARYSAWAAPIFLFASVPQYERCFQSCVIKRTAAVLSIASSVITVLTIVWFGRYNQLHCFRYTPIAELILDKCPQLYNPYPYTFISRTNHIDGGYWGEEYKAVNAYTNNEGYIRKVLVTKESLPLFRQNLVADSDAKQYIFQKTDQYDFKKTQFYYLNLPADKKAFLDKGYPEEFNPLEDATLAEKYEGIYWNEGGIHWFSNQALIILHNENIIQNGLQIQYGVGISRELKEKYQKDDMDVNIYINSRYVDSFPLTDTSGMNTLVLKPERFEKSEHGFYRIRFESDYYIQPSEDIRNSADERKLCFTVSYIGAAQGG